MFGLSQSSSSQISLSSAGSESQYDPVEMMILPSPQSGKVTNICKNCCYAFRIKTSFKGSIEFCSIGEK